MSTTGITGTDWAVLVLCAACFATLMFIASDALAERRYRKRKPPVRPAHAEHPLGETGREAAAGRDRAAPEEYP